MGKLFCLAAFAAIFYGIYGRKNELVPQGQTTEQPLHTA